MNDAKHDPDCIANIAGELLTNTLGKKVSLRKTKVFTTNGSIVVRCEVSSELLDFPRSLIVKKTREDEFGYQPDSPETPNSAHWLFNDWAASEFLNSIPSAIRFSPLIYAGSRDFGLIVLEDLGDGECPNTLEALLCDDEDRAEQTLLEHVSLIGKLHTATIGREKDYWDIRERLGVLPKPKRLFQDPWSNPRNQPIPAPEVEEVFKLYEDVFKTLGICSEAGVNEEIDYIAAAVEGQPDNFVAFCKGDQNLPGDYIRLDGQPRLFDYGGGGFRHALLEGMPGRMTWGCMKRIPDRIVRSMDTAYRLQFKQKHPEISDGMFRRATLEAGARWHIFHIVHRLPEALTRDRLRGLTTLRQQVIAWLDAFANLSDEFCGMPALGVSARRMIERLRSVWSEDTAEIPFYPAFGHHSTP